MMGPPGSAERVPDAESASEHLRNALQLVVLRAWQSDEAWHQAVLARVEAVDDRRLADEVSRLLAEHRYGELAVRLWQAIVWREALDGQVLDGYAR